jgi:hypothetical protein
LGEGTAADGIFSQLFLEDAMRRAGWPLMLLAIAATGCTMCPDPFDYSGPVPNGSATQNDFCARSNGILPLNAAPQPWPPLVDGDDGQAGNGIVVAEYVEADEGTVEAEHAAEPAQPAAATAE